MNAILNFLHNSHPTTNENAMGSNLDFEQILILSSVSASLFCTVKVYNRDGENHVKLSFILMTSQIITL